MYNCGSAQKWKITNFFISSNIGDIKICKFQGGSGPPDPPLDPRMQRPIQNRRAVCMPPVESFLGFVFSEFWLCNTHILCYRKTMLTICILFTILTKQMYGICEGSFKTNPGSKNSTALGPGPPVLKFLDLPQFNGINDE